MCDFNRFIDGAYGYLLDVDDPDECKKRLDDMVDFMVRLRHSFVDNDKQRPVSSKHELNMEILHRATLNDLSVVDIDGKRIIMRE